MNATNRGLGRTALVVVGLALFVAGVATILVQTVPAAASAWHDAARSLADLGSGASREASVTAWTWVLGGGVVLAVLALVVLSALGGGRTGTVVDDDGSSDGVAGSVRIDAAAVQHALSTAVGAMPEVGSLAVDVHRVRGRSALRIRVHPRRGASPRAITSGVEGIVADLDALLGDRLPVLLEIARGGSGSGRTDRVR
ncbi:hypothetical protein [Curtobacterium sp. L1-20]|uniref:hypothetical protein n=1 Tax=Curtobacterium sp. L1-20 TaxID=3138181 RepID=UPI003B51C2C8